jgi:hypothetical protein
MGGKEEQESTWIAEGAAVAEGFNEMSMTPPSLPRGEANPVKDHSAKRG